MQILDRKFLHFITTFQKENITALNWIWKMVYGLGLYIVCKIKIKYKETNKSYFLQNIQ